MLSGAQMAALDERAARWRQRVKTVEIEGRPVVVKRVRRGRASPADRLLRALWSTTLQACGLPMLRAVAANSAEHAQATEVARLRSLRALGVAVPQVLGVGSACFALQHVEGPSLVSLIEPGGAPAFAAWQRGLDALVAAHAGGAAFSNAFARNFIVAAEGLVAIDFEDDPLQAMDLDDAQSRDWLAYLHSTAWLLDAPLAQSRRALEAALARERPAVRRKVLSAGRRLSLLRHLPASRKPFGREAAGAQALARLFAHRPPSDTPR